MEEINLNELINYIKGKIAVIVLIILLTITAGTLYSVFLKVPLYKSTSTIVLASNEGLSGTIQTDITINEKLVDTYKEIVKSRSVLEQVIDSLSLDMTYEELYNGVSVNSVNNTEVIKISVTDVSAEDATLLVSTITDVFSSEVSELYQIENIKILDSASTPNSPYNINLVKEEVIYLFVGMLLSFIVLTITYFFDNKVNTVELVEDIVNLPVLGAVPVIDEKREVK